MSGLQHFSISMHAFISRVVYCLSVLEGGCVSTLTIINLKKRLIMEVSSQEVLCFSYLGVKQRENAKQSSCVICMYTNSKSKVCPLK